MEYGLDAVAVLTHCIRGMFLDASGISFLGRPAGFGVSTFGMQSFSPNNSWLSLCLHVFHTGRGGLARAKRYVKEASFHASGVGIPWGVQGCTPLVLHRHTTY